MPLLNKTYKRIDRVRKYESKNENLNHKAVYNTTIWRNLRLQYLSENPLCERCLKLGKIVSAVEVHHIIPIDMGNNINEKRTLGFDYDNLESLCTDCHTKHHKNKNKNRI